MKVSKKVESEVLKAYHGYFDSYFKGDIGHFGTFVDEDYRVIGTSEVEVLSGKKEMMAFYEAARDEIVGRAEFRNRNIELVPVDGLMLVLEFCDIYILIDDEWRFYSKARLTTFLRQTDAGWKVINQHASLPDSRPQEGETVAFDQIKTENLQLRDAVKRRTIELERKNRDLEIESALERTRTQSMLMQHSGELEDISKVFHEQLLQLGIPSEFSYVWLPDEPNGKHLFWATWVENKGGSGKSRSKSITYDLDKSEPYTAACFAAWESHVPVHQNLIPPDDVAQFFSAWTELIHGTEHLKPELFPEGLYYSEAYMKYGCFGINIRRKLDAEEQEILRRFAVEFERTYTRFLDLKKAEAQAREAQIELALERVRARTMAMQHSDELGDVATLLFKELNQLVENLWTCGFVLCEKDRREDEWWLSTEEGFIPAFFLPNTVDVTHENIYNAWERGETYHTEQLEGKALEEHYDWLMNIPVSRKIFEDMFASGLTLPTWQKLHCAYFSYGYLVMITEVPCPEELIFKRFAKVFDQTYTRFLDLQKAEAQAREAEIELALERVRARTMAMQNSDELKAVIQLVYDQFVQLNIHIEHTGFIMDYKTREDMHIWLSDRHEVPSEITIPYFDSPHWNSFNQAKKKGLDFFTNQLTFEEKNKFYQELFTFIPGLPEEIKEYYMNCPGLAISTVLLDNVGLYIENFSGIPYSDEENDTLKRFGKVFQQTYTRFNDLKQAEAQAREAQIEAALERVRSKTMAMHNSHDVGATVVTLFDEVLKLGLDKSIRCGIGILEGNEGMETWSATSSPTGEVDLKMGMLDMTIHPMLIGLKKAWKRGETGYSYDYIGEDVVRYYKALNNEPAYPFQIDINTLPENEYHKSFFFNEGILFAFAPNPISEESALVLGRFARVFGQTYRRYRDLLKSEAQTREAQIEAGLERVRSRTLAMHSSDELAETAAVVFRQLIDLGIAPNRLYIAIIKDEPGELEFWITDEDGSKVSRKFTGNAHRNKSIQKMYDGWANQKKYMILDMKGKELKEYFHYLSEELNVPFKLGLTQKRRVQNIAYFSKGFIGIASADNLDEKTAHLLQRFAAVFNLTYTRFNDLQVSEAKTREARIEGAMERVRARALAMQQPEELKEVAMVLRSEMGLLGVEELETSSIYINDRQAEKAECWYAIKDAREEQKVLVNDYFGLDLSDTRVGREMLRFYKSSKKKVSILMTGEDRVEWIRYCEAHSPLLRGYYGEVIPDRTYHLYKFSHGAIGVATPGDISAESWNLLERAASVFALAYSRFRDLTQARIDLQHLKEEKHRAETALAELKNTQKQLIHAEKMASLGELTAGIAHEIQNPLNFVNNFAEVNSELLEELSEELGAGDLEEVKAILEDITGNEQKILHHGKRADAIVKGMLQHSRTTAGVKEPTDLNVLADEYLRLSYHGLRAKDKSFNADFQTELDKSLPKVRVSGQDIGRVLLNLINNAFYAVDEKAKQKKEGYKPMVIVATKKLDQKVEVRVKDNGNGIPDALKDKIFQPFFTTKPTGQGTGLGLSLSFDIVKAHGGEIKVESKEREGTTFIIKLPK